MVDRELSSWKEIAAHLGVSVRTSQVWEKECGLPVCRLPGRNRVIAHTGDLDAWKHSRHQPAAPIPRRPWWRGWPIVAGAVGFFVLGLVVAVPRLHPPAPFALRVDAIGFSVVDRTGRSLWAKTFPSPITTENSCPGFPGIAADIDGDGTNEVLFIPNPTVDTAPVPLVAYNADGTERWRFTPGRHVRTQSSSFAPEFKACSITLLPASTGARIAVGSFHRLYFPYQVAFLTGDGRVVREYWHPGHVQATALHDIDADGIPELVLGGVNNARRQATLVAIDPRTTNGAAHSENPDYEFQDLPRATEKARLFFSRSTINKREPYNCATRIDTTTDGITVHVTEQLDNPPATLFYHLTNNLQLRDLSFSDRFAKRTQEHLTDPTREHERLRAIAIE